MAHVDTTVRVTANDNPTPVPSSRLWRDQIAPRVLADLRENQRGQAQSALTSIADTFDTAVQSTHKKLTAQPWTQAGREYALNEARTDAEGMIAVTVDAATLSARDHLKQLETELAAVSEPANGFAAWAIWQKLDSMTASDRNTLLSRTDDPQIVSAVFHAPSVFALGDDDARQRMLANYNRAHRPQPFALAGDLRTFIDAVEGFADMARRELRRALK